MKNQEEKFQKYIDNINTEDMKNLVGHNIRIQAIKLTQSKLLW